MLLELGISAGALLLKYAYHRWLEGEPKRRRGPAQEVAIPRTDEGAPVPLVFGRARVRAPILAWSGDVQYRDTNTEFGTSRVYALDMLFVVGIPMGSGVTRGNSLAGPKLHKVWVGDRALPAPTELPIVESSLYYGQNVTRGSVYGGTANGGGLRGAYYWFGGWTDQSFTASRIGDRMQAWGASRIPGLARQMCVAFNRMVEDSSDPYFNSTRPDTGGSSEAQAWPDHGFVFGESGSMPSVSFEVSTYGDRLNDVSHQHIFSMQNEGVDFGGDADPAEVIYCVLTDTLGKLALPTSLIDTASFAAASQTLKSEGHGYSRAWEEAVEADEIILDVLRQIDGVLDENPTTGKIELRLIRGDYDPNAIRVVNRSNCRRLESFTVGGLSNLINVVRVEYEDRTGDYKVASQIAKNSANAVGQNGQVNEHVMAFLGCKRGQLAYQLAWRELGARSRPIIKCRAIVDRSFIRTRRGDVVKLVWSSPDIAGIVMRVADVDRGSLEDGAIALDLISDHFYTHRGEFPVPPFDPPVNDIPPIVLGP